MDNTTTTNQLDPDLKKIWLAKVLRVDNRNVFTKNGPFSVMTELYDAPEEVRLDKDITMKALMESKEFLWNIHRNFREDKAFIEELFALGYTQDIYRGLTYTLRTDESLFLACCERKEKMETYPALPKSIIENKEVILKALPFVNIFKSIEEKYRYDKDVIACLIAHHPKEYRSLRKRSENFVNKDKNLILKCANFGNNFRYFPDKYKKDMDVIDIALKVDRENVRHVLPELRETKEFALYAIEKFQADLAYFNESLRYDHDVVRLAISKKGTQLNVVNEGYWNNAEMVILASKTTSNLSSLRVSQRLLHNKDVMQVFLDLSPYNYRSMGETLRYDFNLASAELKKNLIIYNELPESLKNNWEILSVAIEHEDFLTKNFRSIPSKITAVFKEFGLDSTNIDGIKKFIVKQSLVDKLPRTLSENTGKIEKKIKI